MKAGPLQIFPSECLSVLKLARPHRHDADQSGIGTDSLIQSTTQDLQSDLANCFIGQNAGSNREFGDAHRVQDTEDCIIAMVVDVVDHHGTSDETLGVGGRCAKITATQSTGLVDMPAR